MKNISQEISVYREAIRHLWNSAFLPIDEVLRFGPCLDLFEEIDWLLFKALVCEPLGIEMERRSNLDPLTGVKVILTSPSVPALINRTIPAAGYWDDPMKLLASSDVELAMIGFFDWDGDNVKDCAYYRVRILNNKSHPYLIGRDALVEAVYATVFLAEGGL